MDGLPFSNGLAGRNSPCLIEKLFVANFTELRSSRAGIRIENLVRDPLVEL